MLIEGDFHAQAEFMRVFTLILSALAVISPAVLAHGVDDATRGFLSGVEGLELGPLLYIGAKHMVTGYDHLLFLFGVVFLLRSLRDVLIYVTLFTIGHSVTLLAGVVLDVGVSAYLVDAVIGLSVVYKGFDNLRGFDVCFGTRPNPRFMVLGFGLVHGLGLATKLLEFELPQEHLFGNLVAFNVGVELGQILALCVILFVLSLARGLRSSERATVVINVLLIAAGTTLTIYQLSGYFLEVGP
jgi:hypothetical protein